MNLLDCDDGDQVFDKVLSLKNCCSYFKEQEEFNELFKALDMKNKSKHNFNIRWYKDQLR